MRVFVPVAVAVLLVACGVGCGTDEPAAREGEHAILDATGARLFVPREVRRIVTTVPGQSEMVRVLGAGDLLVGVSERDPAVEGPSAPARIPTWPSISAERVAARSPDLVLVDRTLSAHDLPGLRGRFRGAFACDSASLDALSTTFERLGEALGRPAEAAALSGLEVYGVLSVR